MNIRHFVSGTSIILAGWLVMTFIEKVPTDRYPTLGRGSVPLETGEETLQNADPREDDSNVVLSTIQTPAEATSR